MLLVNDFFERNYVLKKSFLIHLLCMSLHIFSDDFMQKSNNIFNALIVKVKSMEKDWNKWHEKIYDSEHKLLVDWNQVLLCYQNLPFRVDIHELYDYIFFIEEDFIEFDLGYEIDAVKKHIKSDLYLFQTKIKEFQVNLHALRKVTLESLSRLQS